MIYGEYQEYKRAGVSGTLEPTGSDIEGPFYKPGAPFRETLASPATFSLTGTVRSVNGATVHAVLDFWQADADGVYDNDGYNFRGKVRVDNEGWYNLYTVVPGHYQIGENEFRCGHIHVKVTAPRYKPLTTQLYFAGDKHNDVDNWFDPKRVITMNAPNEGSFDFVLEGDK